MKKDKKKKDKTKILDKLKNNKIFLLIIIIIVIVIIVFSIFYFINKNDNNINKSIKINIGGYDQVLKVKSMTRNINIDSEKYGGRYTKIYVEIKNFKNVDSITSLHQFQLLDSDNNVLSYCYNEGTLPNSNFNDILSNTLTGNKVTSGYLYCPTESLGGSVLRTIVISGGSINEDNTIDYTYENFDLKLS